MSDQAFDPSQITGASWPLPTTSYTYGYTQPCVWYAVGVQESPRESNVTVALLRCSVCGDICAKELPGTWTLEQVRGEAVAETAPR